ncbi:MAG TPA: hypothetical protein VJU54_06625 [Nitrospiraceae bacterium]|nr:hypothetical protein [Nitrospiraceae bacterium]
MPLLILLLLMMANVPACNPAPTPGPATRTSTAAIPLSDRGNPPTKPTSIVLVMDRVRRATLWRTPTAIPAPHLA